MIGPTGDVSRPPSDLRWEPAPATLRYDVRIMEVDRSLLWSVTAHMAGTAPVHRLGLPEDVVARFVPGKTIVWDVTGRDDSGRVVADSGPQQFRVAIQ